MVVVAERGTETWRGRGSEAFPGLLMARGQCQEKGGQHQEGPGVAAQGQESSGL